MLSKKDIIRELGRNIIVYPLIIDNIRENSIDLTASKWAWTISGVYAYNKETGKIIIPPSTSVVIVTNEVLYTSNYIGGTCHSRVSLTLKGLGHIGTMVDPNYYGQPIITLTNHTLKEISVDLNDRIVSLVFHYLRTRTIEGVNPRGHEGKIAMRSIIDGEEIIAG